MLLPPIDNTCERFAHYSKRKARWYGNIRFCARSHPGVCGICGEYVKRCKYFHGEGILNAKLNKKVVPNVAHQTSVIY